MIIKQVSNLKLDIQKTPYRYWLNIIKQFKDSDVGYVICGFEYNKDEDFYYLESCDERIIDKDIDWLDLEYLIKYGFKILKGGYTLKELYEKGIKEE
jgi:hypothetical protein